MRKIALVGLLLLAACHKSPLDREAHFYPVNDAANRVGMLSGAMAVSKGGFSQLSMQLPDGETMTGDASVDRVSEGGFGSIIAKVDRADNQTADPVTVASRSKRGPKEGRLDAYGNRGTGLKCEFYSDLKTEHGHGACITSKGAFYRMQF